MHYSIVIGTHRKNSNSEKIAHYYTHLLQSKQINNVQEINLQHLPHDFLFSDSFGNRSEEFQKIQDIINLTDKFIFIIPEYNGSFPGVLKAFIDSCDYPNSFFNKKACLVGISSGQFGNLRGLEHFMGVANYINMTVFQNQIYLPSIYKDLNKEGIFNNPKIEELIDKQLDEFIKF